MIDRTPTIMDIQKYSRYSVVIPLIQTPSGYEVLFEVRSLKLKHQPGEICFPGGRAEAQESPWETAMRETCEELLITKSQFKEVMPLDIFISPFGMIIYPFAVVLEDYHDSLSCDEVEEVFTVPLSFFKAHEPECYICRTDNCPGEDFPYEKIPGGRDYPWRQGRYEVNFYEYKNRNIWGLTAKLLKASLPLIDKMMMFLEDNDDEDEKEKSSPMITADKKLKKIVEFYFMTPAKTDAKALSQCIHSVSEEQVEVWRELNLMEVVLDSDSLIFQDARECFIDPLDLEFIDGHGIQTMYQISYEIGDSAMVKKIMCEIIDAVGGFVCSDTDSFEPIYTKENMKQLGEEE